MNLLFCDCPIILGDGCDVLHVLLFDNNIMQVNPDVIGTLEEAGLQFVGKDESGKRMEVSF